GAHVGAAGRRRADPRLRPPRRVQRADRGGPRLQRRARGRGAARAARGLSPPARRRRAGAPRPAGRERVRRRARRGDGPDGGEPERVRAAVAALEVGDLVRLGALLDASHASLRDDYEVSTPEVDQLVEVARAQPETLGARLTGGGFGGAIVALVRRGVAAAVAERVTRSFTRRTGRAATVLVPPPGARPWGGRGPADGCG